MISDIVCFELNEEELLKCLEYLLPFAKCRAEYNQAFNGDASIMISNLEQVHSQQNKRQQSIGPHLTDLLQLHSSEINLIKRVRYWQEKISNEKVDKVAK